LLVSHTLILHRPGRHRAESIAGISGASPADTASDRYCVDHVVNTYYHQHPAVEYNSGNSGTSSSKPQISTLFAASIPAFISRRSIRSN